MSQSLSAQRNSSLSRLVLNLVFDNLQKIVSFFSILFFMASISLIIYISFTSVNDEQKFYSENLQKAREANDPRAVRLCLDALLSLQPDNMQIRYEYARFLEAAGLANEAAPLLEGMASLEDDSPGFDEAHWLVGKRLWMTRGTDSTKAEKALKHLSKAVEMNPKNEQFRADYGAALFEAGRIMDAYPHAMVGVRIRPELAMFLAPVVMQRDRKLAADLVQNAEAPLLNRMKADPTNEFYFVTLARIYKIKGKPEDAIKILESYLANRESKAVRQELGTAMADVIAGLLQKPPVDIGQVMALLERGLSIDPENVNLFAILESVAITNKQFGPDLIQKLQELVVKGKSMGLAHLALSNVRHTQGKTDLARLHLELAVREIPAISGLATNFGWFLAKNRGERAPEIYNNLAWYLVNSPPRDPEKALWLVNQALAIQPNNSNFLETRGQILVLLGQWKDALVDLERSLAQRGETEAIHRSLALCYGKLGNKELADMHQGKADKLKPPPIVPGVNKRRPG